MRLLSGSFGALFAAALLISPMSPSSTQIWAQPEVTRVSATLNGVFSARGYFNILVPLMHMQGVSAAKLDLKPSLITIDFADGVPVSQEKIRHVIIEAGYRPGNVLIQRFPERQARETGPGWIRINHPKTKNPLVRWLEENF